MSIADKLKAVADNVPKVYEAGQKSMVDESKIIEKTASGIGFVSVDDVSEIPHEIKVQLSSDTITDFSGVEVTRYGKNLFDISSTLGFQSQFGGLSNNVDGNNLIVTCGGSNRTGYLDLGILQAGIYTIYLGGSNSTTKRIYIGDTLSSVVDTGYASTTETLTFVLTETSRAWVMRSTFTPDKSPYTFSNIQLEFGSTTTYYEPYTNPVTRTANADGTVEGITSLSPYVCLRSNVGGVSISMTYHKSWGMQAAYDRFWDKYQDNGKRTVYDNCFSGGGWTDELFKPKYDIQPTGAYMMFRSTGIKDLTNLDVKLDFSKATSIQYMFQWASTEKIGVFDVNSVTTLSSTFAYASKLHTIEKFILRADGSNIFSGTFDSARALTNITFEGVIGNDFNIKDAPLSKASIESILSALSKTTTGKALTLNKAAVDEAFKENIIMMPFVDLMETQEVTINGITFYSDWTTNTLKISGTATADAPITLAYGYMGDTNLDAEGTYGDYIIGKYIHYDAASQTINLVIPSGTTVDETIEPFAGKIGSCSDWWTLTLEYSIPNWTVSLSK